MHCRVPNELDRDVVLNHLRVHVDTCLQETASQGGNPLLDPADLEIAFQRQATPVTAPKRKHRLKGCHKGHCILSCEEGSGVRVGKPTLIREHRGSCKLQVFQVLIAQFET